MRIISIVVFLLACISAYAQDEIKSTHDATDTVSLSNDSVVIHRKKVSVEAYVKRFNPRKALFYSAILPGAGQAYNKKYWKIPLVWGGLGALVYVVKYYSDAELYFRDELFYNINHGLTTNPTSNWTTDQLRTQESNYRRQRDYISIFAGIFYILQIVDAHVDAHLKEFDVNPRFHVKIEPSYSPMNGAGMGVVVRF